MWDEHNQSLQSYCAKVKRLVDSFEKEMANCPAAKRAQYHLRFVNGLPDDYVEHVKLSLPPKCLDVDKARDVCMQFQSCKRARSKKTDVGATVTFQDPTVTARLTQHETELVRLKEQMKHMAAANNSNGQQHNAGTKSYAGRSPFRQPSDFEHSSTGQTDNANQQGGRWTERLKRFRDRGGLRGSNFRGRRGNNNNFQQNRNNTPTRASQPSQPSQSSTEGSHAYLEQDEEDAMNGTLALYMESKQLEDEEDFAQFCMAKDREFPEN